MRFCRSGPGIRDAAVVAVLRAAFFVVNHTVRRGHYTTCRMVGTLASSGAYAEFIVPGGGRFRAHPRDGYWMRSLSVQRRYEPELLPVVEKALQVGMRFLDCGANLGWWAVIAGSTQQGPERVLAVEASPSTFRGLSENHRLNGDTFRTLQAAVWSRSGETVDFVEARESAASSVAQTSLPMMVTGRHRRVPTATLDELLTAVAPDGEPVLCKLDVEGAEVEALSTSELIRSGDVAVVFEDHGSDPTSATSMWFLERGYIVHVPAPDGTLMRITDIASINAFKVDPARGYNFLAWAVGGAAEQLFGPQVR